MAKVNKYEVDKLTDKISLKIVIMRKLPQRKRVLIQNIKLYFSFRQIYVKKL